MLPTRVVALVLDVGEVGLPEHQNVGMGSRRHEEENSRLICNIM